MSTCALDGSGSRCIHLLTPHPLMPKLLAPLLAVENQCVVLFIGGRGLRTNSHTINHHSVVTDCCECMTVSPPFLAEPGNYKNKPSS